LSLIDSVCSVALLCRIQNSRWSSEVSLPTTCSIIAWPNPAHICSDSSYFHALNQTVNLYLSSETLGEAGAAGGIMGILATTTVGAFKSNDQNKKEHDKVFSELVNDESVNQQIHIPDYSEKMGFEYAVEKDIKKIIDDLPEKHKPLVIFIDDLDRCPPNKVARIIEALNRITNSELGCNFVLGMDTELVSAALEKEYEDVIEKLPSYAQDIPIGWKFMDKFIQLPIILPPADDEDLKLYLANQRVKKFKEVSTPPQTPAGEPPKVPKKEESQEPPPDIDEDQKRIDKNKQERERAESKFVNIAEEHTDDESQISNLIETYAPNFSKNPREIKRFLNLYRLLIFIMKIREMRSGIEKAEPPEIARWIDLSLHWPMLIPWIVRGSDDMSSIFDDFDKPTLEPEERLDFLEDLAEKHKNNANSWNQDLKTALRFDDDEKVPWLNDVKLLKFFKDDLKLSKLNDRGLY